MARTPARLLSAAAVVLSAGALVLTQVAGGASGPPTGWNGENPFNCELQNAGFGPTGPHPDADPYCIEFDKRHQNVSELGVVDFLSKEPARVAAASPKCFYFQSDHWRGSVVQSDGSTKTYEWDGHYYFDKARAEGGVWVTNFNFNGQTGDASALPGMPPEYAKFFGPGTGGMITHDEVQADPSCVEKARANPSIYAKPAAGGVPARGCIAAKGAFGPRAIGPAAVGATDRRLRSDLGDPIRVKRGFLRWCLLNGGSLRAGERSDRSGELGGATDERALVVLTTSPFYSLRGVRPGGSAAALRRAFRHRVAMTSVGLTRIYAVRRRSGVLVGVRHGRIRFLALYDRRALRTSRALRAFFERAS
jgi:hypothetical protein